MHRAARTVRACDSAEPESRKLVFYCRTVNDPGAQAKACRQCENRHSLQAGRLQDLSCVGHSRHLRRTASQ